MLLHLTLADSKSIGYFKMMPEAFNLRPLDVPKHAMPDVERPKPFPTGSRFDTSTEHYAASYPLSYLSVLQSEKLTQIATSKP